MRTPALPSPRRTAVLVGPSRRLSGVRLTLTRFGLATRRAPSVVVISEVYGAGGQTGRTPAYNADFVELSQPDRLRRSASAGKYHPATGVGRHGDLRRYAVALQRHRCPRTARGCVQMTASRRAPGQRCPTPDVDGAPAST